jgi:hypothetical protein
MNIDAGKISALASTALEREGRDACCNHGLQRGNAGAVEAALCTTKVR